MNQRNRHNRREEAELLRELARQEGQSSRRRGDRGDEVDPVLPGNRDSETAPNALDFDPREEAAFERNLREYGELNAAAARAIQHEEQLVKRATLAAQGSPAPPWEAALRQRMIDETEFLRSPDPDRTHTEPAPIHDLPPPPGASWPTQLSRAAMAVAILSAGWFLAETFKDPNPGGSEVAGTEPGAVEPSSPLSPVTPSEGANGPQLLGSSDELPILGIEFQGNGDSVKVHSLDGRNLDVERHDFRAYFHPAGENPTSASPGEGFLLRDLDFELSEFIRDHGVELSSGSWIMTVKMFSLNRSTEIGFGSLTFQL